MDGSGWRRWTVAQVKDLPLENYDSLTGKGIKRRSMLKTEEKIVKLKSDQRRREMQI